MKLGFNTMCLYEADLEQVAQFAAKNGFAALEIPCNPKGESGVHHLDVEDAPEKADGIKKMLADRDLEISCLSYYANPLAGDEGLEKFNGYFGKVIEAAGALGIKYVSTFTGRDASVDIEENLKRFAEVFQPHLDKAREHDVKILLENTPLLGGYVFGGNFAYSPEMWDMIFQAVPDENLGLNFDPSHLFWMGIDYQVAYGMFSERVCHVQAKDSEILTDRLRTCGIYGTNWFRYRLPGMGAIDWKALVTNLYDNGYDGVVAIENEDVMWWNNQERAQKGLLLSKKILNHLII